MGGAAGFHHRKDGGVGADAEGERDDGDDREAGGFAEHASTVADVLPERFDRALPPHVADPLLHRLRAAHFDARGAHRLFPAHSRAHLRFGHRIEVAAQLLVHLPLRGAFAEKHPQTRK